MKMSFNKILICCYWFITIAGAQDSEGDPDEGIKIGHAVLGSVAWVFILPLGAILLRVLNGRTAVYVHAGTQVFGTIIIIANAGLGIRLALDNEEISEYHPIIGLVLFALLFFQALGGIVHHLSYRKHSQKTIVSHIHVWMGRALITLGMINGGLGLNLADDASRGDFIAYGVVAGIIWLIWIGIDLGLMFKKDGVPTASESKLQ